MQEETAMRTTSEQPVTRVETPVTEAAQAAASLAASTEQMTGFVSHFAEVARAESCVGPAQSANGHTVVPLATVTVQAAFGMGFGGGSGAQANQEGSGSGGGGGGGGRGSSRVMAIADISEDGLRIQPVPDVTMLGLAAMALAGVLLLSRRGRGGAGVEKMARGRLLGLLKRD